MVEAFRVDRLGEAADLNLVPRDDSRELNDEYGQPRDRSLFVTLSHSRVCSNRSRLGMFAVSAPARDVLMDSCGANPHT